MKQIFFALSVFVVFGFFSCQEEEDCGTCGIDPKLTVRFDPSLSRKAIENQLKPVNTRIKNLRDSLRLTLEEDVLARVTADLAAMRQDSTSISEPLRYFKSGKIYLNSIGPIGRPAFAQWQDTVLNTVRIPVDMLHDTSEFYFSYHGRSDTLQVRYERELVQTLTGVRMSLRNMGVIAEKSTFDSLIFKCPGGQCSNDRASINILF